MRINIKYKSVAFLLILIPFLEPGYITVTDIEPLFSMARKILFVVGLVAIIILFLKGRNRQQFGILGAVYAYFIVLGIITAVSATGDLSTFGNTIIVDISICNFTFLWLRYDYRTCIKYLLTYIEVLLVINLCTIILFPDGLYEVQRYTGYFLGYDNTHIRWIIPGLTLSLIDSHILSETGKWKPNFLGIHPRTIIMWFIALAHVLISLSSTSIVGLLVFTILVLVLNKRHGDKISKKMNIFSFSTAVFIAIAGTIVVVFIANSFLGDLVLRIEMLFNKSLEDVRMTLWRAAISAIKENPLFGVGVESSESTMYRMTGSNFQGQSAHNYILNVLYQCGFVGFLFFANIYRVIGKKINSYKGTLISSYVCIYFITVAVMGITEPQHGAVCLYVMWCIGYFVPVINRELSFEGENNV